MSLESEADSISTITSADYLRLSEGLDGSYWPVLMTQVNYVVGVALCQPCVRTWGVDFVIQIGRHSHSAVCITSSSVSNINHIKTSSITESNTSSPSTWSPSGTMPVIRSLISILTSTKPMRFCRMIRCAKRLW